MIYTASLNVPIKKALGKQVMQSNLNKICEQIAIDPETTNMDVVIFGPKDLIGPKATKVQQALAKVHPDICTIYLYENDNESDLIECQYKYKCKKMKSSDIENAFEEAVSEHKTKRGKRQITSADFDNDELQEQVSEDEAIPNRVPLPVVDDLPPLPPLDEPVDNYNMPLPDLDTPPIPKVSLTKESDDAVPLPDLDIPPIDNSQFTQPVNKPMDTQPAAQSPLSNPIPTPVEPLQTVEDSLSKMTNFDEWRIMQDHLHHDSIVKSLINENSEYVGLIQTLDVLDQRIEAVWRDTALTPNMKFEKIKEIGLERAVVRATTNSINVEKVISIISTIVLSAKRTVDEKLNSVNSSMNKITADKEKIMDSSYINRAIEERTKVQLELLNISRGIVDLYKSIDSLVTDEIAELDRKLPSANQFINDMVKPIGTQIFTPANTAALANKLLRALQENNVVASQLEESVNAMIENLFQLCNKDEEIIQYQQNMINLLKANRVEDVIITNTLLKKVLRLYVGTDNSGRSATAITWSGILSRRHNCILIDVTGRAKFEDYGVQPISFDDFVHGRQETSFLCVDAGKQLSPEELQVLVHVVKSKLNYYSYVNIIVAPEDANAIDQLSDEALCIHYITDCTTSSIRDMREVIKRHKTQNIARKLVTIDTPVSPLMIADSIGIDPTITKVISLPNVPAVRACALRHDRPYEYNDVVQVYEEAFR